MQSFEVVELRRYAMRPGGRDALIALFEREFVETQEARGMTPFGHYRDLDDDDLFVWLRGFPSRAKRGESLAGFYGSPDWTDHRAAANETMLDSSNVLQLREARSGTGFDLGGLSRPPVGARDDCASYVGIGIFMLDALADDALIRDVEVVLLPRLRAHATRTALLVTDASENPFPRLPVREEFALVAVGSCGDRKALDGWTAAFSAEPLGAPSRDRILGREVLRLRPAARSLFR